MVNMGLLLSHQTNDITFQTLQYSKPTSSIIYRRGVEGDLLEYRTRRKPGSLLHLDVCRRERQSIDILLKSKSAYTFMLGVLDIWYDPATGQLEICTYDTVNGWAQVGPRCPWRCRTVTAWAPRPKWMAGSEFITMTT